MKYQQNSFAWRQKKHLLLLLCLLIFSVRVKPAFAQDQPLPDAFTYTDLQAADLTEEQAGQLTRYQADKTNSTVNLITLRPNQLAQADGININLPDGQNLPLSVIQVERRAEADFTFLGSNPEDINEATLVVRNGEAVGTIQANDQIFRVRPLGDNLHVIMKVDQNQFPEEDPPTIAANAPPSSSTKGLFMNADALPGATQDDGSIVTVMVLYTAEARSKAGNIDGLIQLAFDETNESYTNSQVNLHLQLVHSAEVTYAESGSTQTDVDHLTGLDDGVMDDIHTLRDTYAADVVILLIGHADYCGQAAAIMADAPTAFAVVVESCATGYLSFGHEIGHLQGARHNPEADPTHSPFHYGHGFYNEAGHFRTVMSYNCPSGCTRFKYWSNPSVTTNSIVIGTTDTQNNAQVLNETAFTVANFRINNANRCLASATSSRSGIDGTAPDLAFDQSVSTFFTSSYDDWQYIELDLGCIGTFSAIRRYMTTNGTAIDGARDFQGEGASYSLDGNQWVQLTANNSTGWEKYVNYGSNQHAWHTVNYGWSEWLKLTTPTQARFVRFQWDGNFDSVNEISTIFQPLAEVSAADLKIAALSSQAMSTDGAITTVRSAITVQNEQDDTARDITLVLVLPPTSRVRSTLGESALQNDGYAIFHLPSLDVGMNYTFEIETEMQAAQLQPGSTLVSAFVYNSLPDSDPDNNFAVTVIN